MDPIPILKMGEFLLVTIQIEVTDEVATRLQEDLTNRIVATGAAGVLIEISALRAVDSFIGRILTNIATMAKLLDADTVIVGMQPAVAITLVELGVPLQALKTALDVDRGIALLRARSGANGGGRSS